MCDRPVPGRESALALNLEQSFVKLCESPQKRRPTKKKSRRVGRKRDELSLFTQVSPDRLPVFYYECVEEIP